MGLILFLSRALGGWRGLALAGLAGAVIVLVPTHLYYQAKLATLKTEQAQREAAITTAVLETQTAEIHKMQGVLENAQAQTVTAQRDADAARAATERLRRELASYRKRHAATTTSAGEGESGSDPIGVLADLLSRMGEAGERISRYADEVKIAGAACEKLSTN